MAWETINPGNGGDSETPRVEREVLRYDYNLAFEGTVVGFLPEKDGMYGKYRPLLADTVDGRNIMVRADGLLREALEAAELQPGYGLRVKVERRVSSTTKNVYRKPIVQVNREMSAASPAAQGVPMPAEARAGTAPVAAPADSDDEELPF